MIDFPASPTDGQIFSASNGVVYKWSATYSSWLTGTPGSSGKLLQTVNIETGAVATGTTILPGDDTIPQITEGNEYMTLAITPQSATSKLIIEVTAVLASNAAAGNILAAALFQDSTANALAVVSMPTAAAPPSTLSFRHVMTSGTTSSTTFRVRAGCGIAGTTVFNGNGGSAARLFGGVMASSIVITEVLP